MHDWQNVTPIFQPVRRKIKTNRTVYAWFLPRFDQVIVISLELWLVHCTVCSCCDWSALLLWNWFENRCEISLSIWKDTSCHFFLHLSILRVATLRWWWEQRVYPVTCIEINIHLTECIFLQISNYYSKEVLSSHSPSDRWLWMTFQRPVLDHNLPSNYPRYYHLQIIA